MLLQNALPLVYKTEMGGEIEWARHDVVAFLGGFQQPSRYRRDMIGRIESCLGNVGHQRLRVEYTRVRKGVHIQIGQAGPPFQSRKRRREVEFFRLDDPIS
jgi:hypothetical protein